MDLAPGGLRYGLVLVAAGLPALLIHPAVAAMLVALGVGAVWFHRDPERSVPSDGWIAPADGTVSVIRSASTEGGQERLLVGTFMNVHDVHVNRAPVPASVADVEHVPGANRPAFSKDSDRNERVIVDLDTAAGPTTVTLIAGAFARRIHPYVEPGNEVGRGERIGHISFGSRVDVLFPPAIDRDDLAIEEGESVTAGETVLVPEAALSGE